MSWIKLTQYLPGDNRKIQIWNEPRGFDHEPKGNNHGYYESGKWWAIFDNGGVRQLTHVTHWAEMLGRP